MKYNLDNLLENVRRELIEYRVDSKSRERILDGVKMLQECHYPTFDQLDFSNVEADDKSSPLRVTLNSESNYEAGDGYSNVSHEITLTIDGSKLLVDDDENHFKGIFSDTKHEVIFRIGNDVVYVLGSKDGEYYRNIKLALYTDAWEDMDGLDLDIYEPDFEMELGTRTVEYRTYFFAPFLPCCGVEGMEEVHCINICYLNSLNALMKFAALYCKWVNEKELDCFKTLVKE